MTKTFLDYKIGINQPIFLIAEAGVNHNGDINKAFELVDAAVYAGADAVKFQTFITEENISKDTPLAKHHLKNVGKSLSHFDLIKKLELPFDSFKKLKDYCSQKNIYFISTPYDLISAKFLINLNVEIMKIASSEMLNFPLLEIIAKSKIPIILSTGMSSWIEIEEALEFLNKFNAEVCVLKCTSNYPANPKNINLLGLKKIREKYPNVVPGFSDHTNGTEISLASIGIGSCLIERHFTLDKKAWGPDHSASMTPDEFKNFVKQVRKVEKSFGNYNWDIQKSEITQKDTMRKGVYARCSMKKGDQVRIENVKFLRPLGKITPKDFYINYLNKFLCTDILAETEVTPDHFSGK